MKKIFTYSKIVNIKNNVLWKYWIDVNNWHYWQNAFEFAILKGDFIVGNKIMFKLKNKKNIFYLDIIKVIIEKKYMIFTDCTNFPLTKMYGEHEVIMKSENESIIQINIFVEGLFSFFWKYFLIDDIINNIPDKMDNFIRYIEKIEAI